MPAIVDSVEIVSHGERQAFLHHHFKTKQQAVAPAKQQLSEMCLALICAIVHIDSRSNNLCLFTSVKCKKAAGIQVAVGCNNSHGVLHVLLPMRLMPPETGQSLSIAAHVCNAMQNA